MLSSGEVFRGGEVELSRPSSTLSFAPHSYSRDSEQQRAMEGEINGVLDTSALLKRAREEDELEQEQQRQRENPASHSILANHGDNLDAYSQSPPPFGAQPQLTPAPVDIPANPDVYNYVADVSNALAEEQLLREQQEQQQLGGEGGYPVGEPFDSTYLQIETYDDLEARRDEIYSLIIAQGDGAFGSLLGAPSLPPPG